MNISASPYYEDLYSDYIPQNKAGEIEYPGAIIDLDVGFPRSDNEIIDQVCSGVRKDSLLARASMMSIDYKFTQKCRDAGIKSCDAFKIKVFDEEIDKLVQLACYSSSFNERINNLVHFYEPSFGPITMKTLMEALRGQDYVASILNPNKTFKNLFEYKKYILTHSGEQVTINGVDIGSAMSHTWRDHLTKERGISGLYHTFGSNGDSYGVNESIDESTKKQVFEDFTQSGIAY